jgi:hypothetical protein
MSDHQHLAEVREGDVLAGKYRVDKVLGVGGMGVLVAAHHIQLDDRVAIKFLLPATLGNQDAVARFAREARVGGFFGLRAKSLNDQSNQNGHCTASNKCDPIGGAKRDDAKGAATVATAMLIAGSVLTATGVTLFLVGGPKEQRVARVEATPVVSWNQAAMVVRGRF